MTELRQTKHHHCKLLSAEWK